MSRWQNRSNGLTGARCYVCEYLPLFKPCCTSVLPAFNGTTTSFAFTVTDPNPGSGPSGLHYSVKNANGSIVDSFVAGANGTIKLSGEIDEFEFWSEDLAGNTETHHLLKVNWQRPTLSQLSDYQALGDKLGAPDPNMTLANLADSLDWTYWFWHGYPKAVALQVDFGKSQSLLGFKL